MNTLSTQKAIIVLSDVGLFLIYAKHNLLSSQNDYFIAFLWGEGVVGEREQGWCSGEST